MSHELYLCSVFLHVLAATIWVGGNAFLVLVVVPYLRADGSGVASAVLRATGPRFSRVGWVCFAIALVTGTANLAFRGVTSATLFSSEFHDGTYGRLVIAKLGAFAATLLLAAIHDFKVGPAALRAMEAAPTSSASTGLRRQASVLGRINAVLALTLVALGVMLVRGVPG